MLACKGFFRQARVSLIDENRAAELFAIESIPMAGVNGAVRIFDDDTMDRKINVSCLSDGEIMSKGCFCNFFN